MLAPIATGGKSLRLMPVWSELSESPEEQALIRTHIEAVGRSPETEREQ
jgi:hypothetical protein